MTTSPDHDETIRSMARRQHGVVTRAQLLAAGVPGRRIDRRAEQGWLHRVHRGIYRVGPLPSKREREVAAVLGCGETAVLSHRSAAGAWKLASRQGRTGRIHVSVERGNPLRASGNVRVHRNVVLHTDERTRLRGIPVTTPARTLLDIAGAISTRGLEQALARAFRRGLTDSDDIAKLLDRYPCRHGAGRLRRLLGAGDDYGRARSEAESAFLALIDRAQLPRPRVNVSVQGLEVDFHWRKQRLVVEVDGFRYHSSSGAFEKDRRRDAVLVAEGYGVVRVTWRQLTEEREATIARLAQALARASQR